MPVSDFIPGYRPGHLRRNVLVGIVYLILSPLWFLILPGVAAYHLYRNTNNIGRYVGLSGDFGPIRRILNALATFVFGSIVLFVAMILLLSMAFGGASSGPAPGADSPSTVIDAETLTPTSEPIETPSLTSASEGSTTEATSPSQTLSAGVTVTVTEVVDGDTVKVRFPDGRVETVRLLGVDTPEVHTETSPDEWEGIASTQAGRDHLRDWGHKSSEFVRSEVGGTEVTIQTDSQADRRGSYGRLLVYLSHDGELLNRQLLEQGYARLYESSFSERDAFASAEQSARTDDIGVWGYEDPSRDTPTATPVPDGGESAAPSDLEVTGIHADAEGNDHENLNDEYITFTNTGDGTLDLSGWTVADEADHTYYVPSGFTLGPGESVTLYTGSGADSDTELYWGSESAIWNNGGDTIIVTTDDGETAVEETYS